MNNVILSLLVENHFGVLTRITNLFSQRGFNIDSLAVGETENPGYSRVTIATHGDENIINQIRLQLDKLEDVKIVSLIPDEQQFIREVALIKLAPGKEQLEALDGVLEDFGGRKQIIEDDCCIIEVTATPATINFFVEELREYHIKEVCRTGCAALALSQETVY